MKTALKAALLVSSALVATPVLAQTQPTPPEHYTLDPRGVDLVQGVFNAYAEDVVIGRPDEGGIVHARVLLNGGWRDVLSGTISISGSTYIVSVGAQSYRFTRSGIVFTPLSGGGETLTQSGSNYTFKTSDGTVAIFTGHSYSAPWTATNAALQRLVKPNGDTLTFYNLLAPYCPNGGVIEDCQGAVLTAIRPQAVVSNRGYMVKFSYKEDDIDTGSLNDWMTRTAAVSVNLAVDYCDPFAPACAGLTEPGPSVSYVASSPSRVSSVTDQSGRTTTYSYGASGLSGIRRPGSTSDDVSISYAAGKVSGVTNASGAWSYVYSDSTGARTTTATGPLNQRLVVTSDLAIGRAVGVADGLGRTWRYRYDGNGRLDRVIPPEGDVSGGYVDYFHDARGNVTQTLYVPKSGSGLGNLTTSATFPASCSNPVTCNRPTSTTDARGAVTDYSWNGTHGGLESVTLPAPTSGATRPQTRIAYAAQTAYYKNSAGTIVASPTPVTLPVSVSSCATGAAPSCVGTTDEVRQTVQYGSPGVANNLLPTVGTQQDGTGTLSASVTTTYTANGDVASVDGPLAGSDDTTYYRYDTARRPVGVIGPDPDGAGSLMRRAQRVTYDAAGRATQVEQGAVNGITDGDWSGFVSLQQQLTAYDGFGRPVITALHGGGQAHAVTHVGYDAAGRPSCVAQRMNPAAFNSLPGSACDLGAQGAYGPDRITRSEYDAAGQLVATTSGHGTASPITESATYTANGKPLTLKDGNGNVSTMVYDGFDRLSRMNYPNATTGAGASSTSDYEEYGYDAGSNVVSYRNRAGETITAGYDALNRTVAMGGAAIADRTLAYDNLGRVTGTSFTGGGAASTRTWDALGRLTSETQAGIGTMSYGYDAAGRRTWMSWPDGFWAAYDYNYAGDLTAIRENGATAWSLSSWAYDNLGRPIAQGRANGATTYWAYDGASRVTALTQDLAGTASDVTLNLAYNPAGQIVTRTLSNPAYAYAPGTGNTAYVNNGRNQVTSVNGAGVGYDGRQNITAIPGVGGYGYNGSNELTSATVGGTTTGLSYDPGGRLYQSGSTRFLYDGQQVVGEYDASGGLLRRYVPGLGLDTVITAYEGAGYDRRWLIPDERGSVVSITDGAANAIATNTYDEYGQPGSGNAGRFQYTGQMWLPEAQLYHYRARAYAPQLGRFMQTDPIGYRAGANIYAYVGADPVNWRDPFGLTQEPTDLPGPVVTGSRCPQNSVCDLQSIQNIIDRYVNRYLNDPIVQLSDIIVVGVRDVIKTANNNIDATTLWFWSNYCPTVGFEGALGGVAEGKIGARGLVSGNAGVDLTSIRGRLESRFTRQGPELGRGLFVTQGGEATVEFGLPEVDGGGLELGTEAKRETTFGPGMFDRLAAQPFANSPSGFIGLQGGTAFVVGGKARAGVQTGPC